MQEFIQHLINGVSLGSIYALIALGYTMVYGILQLINFAHSEVYMMGAFASYFFARMINLESHPGLAGVALLLAVAISSTAILGMAIERFAYRPLRHAPKVNALITAIGVSLFLQYMTQILFGAEPKAFPIVFKSEGLFSMQFASGKVDIQNLDVMIFGISILFMGGLHYLIYHTKMGKAMRAVNASHVVAGLMGINTDRVVSMTFALGSALAGVGSVLVSLKYPQVDPFMGTLFGIKSFVAAVLGGIGNLMGAVIGGIIMGLSEEFVAGYFSSTYRDAVAFGILIFILLFKPAGLFGKSQTEKV